RLVDDNCDPRIPELCVDGHDGVQDINPATGALATQELARTQLRTNYQELQWQSKLKLMVAPGHTIEAAYYGSPTSQSDPRMRGTPLRQVELQGGQDATARWVSKLFDHKWQLEAALAFHREHSEMEFADPVLAAQAQIRWNTDPVRRTSNQIGRRG